MRSRFSRALVGIHALVSEAYEVCGVLDALVKAAPHALGEALERPISALSEIAYCELLM